MILVDPRAGSKELVDPLTAAGLPVEVTHLDFGDLAFLGRGEGGKQIFIGIEHKKLPDLVSSIVSDRIVSQLRGTLEHPGGMLAMYDRHYLIIEGEWDTDESGAVIVPTPLRGLTQRLKGAPMASVLEARVWTLEHRGGMRTRWTRNQKETIRHVSTLYRQWTDRDLDKHGSHLAVHAPDLDRALRTPLTLKRQIAAMLPGIGFQKSEAVDKYFGSILEMTNADEAEWREIEGIGTTLAKRLVAACRERE